MLASSPTECIDFTPLRRGVIGHAHLLRTWRHPEGIPLLYADWTASGRAYAPIEHSIQEHLLPLIANTHTDTNSSGSATTHAYGTARDVLRRHVNARADDVLICTGSGMTGAVNKLQRLMGLKRDFRATPALQPLVFVTHMEHHSNQTSWLETGAEVVLVECNTQGLVCAEQFAAGVAAYPTNRPKYAAITACSNVTGIETPYHDIARVMHAAGGYCFVDFACSAPYVTIDMHPPGDPGAGLDAVYFSPHKFLGGPGSCGVLIVNERHFHHAVPDHPGGGTVSWTNPWGQHRYTASREEREDGGTPPVLQTVRAAMAVRLKERMGTVAIRQREDQLMRRLWSGLDQINGLDILDGHHRERLGIVSFNIPGLHHNLAVKLLNDYFGVQVRGGCSCAGTYGHRLLGIDRAASEATLTKLDRGEPFVRPGWVRLSIHPTMTEGEIDFLVRAIGQVATNFETWSIHYRCEETGSVSALDAVPDRALLEEITALF